MMLRRTLTFAALGFAVAGVAQAQTASENRDADALAADMRLLAANPLDIEALITAGELTLGMGDSTAAAAFFGRAEKLDPNNPRIKAGLGSLMVRAERPGKALVRFQEAERRGLNPSKFAGDRGLAYDLIGEQERAQRDYRMALRDRPRRRSDAPLRAVAGDFGQEGEALKLLDPLIQRSDRAAWRDRAFILAMNGDSAGAEKIAETMMTPGLGAGLIPFFRRLPQLSPADRAFAVNFGETRARPERVADAQLVPPLARLGPDPYAPKVIAAVVTPVARAGRGQGQAQETREGRGSGRRRTPIPAPVEVAAATPVYVPPREMPRPAPADSCTGAAPDTCRAEAVATARSRTGPATRANASAGSDARTGGRSGRLHQLPRRRLNQFLCRLLRHRRRWRIRHRPRRSRSRRTRPRHFPRIRSPAPPTSRARPRPVCPSPPPPRGSARIPSSRGSSPDWTSLPGSRAQTTPRTGCSRAAGRGSQNQACRRAQGCRVTDAGQAGQGEPADAAAGPAKGSEKLADARDARGRPIKADDEPVLDRNGCPIPPKTAKGRAASSAKTGMTAREKANDVRCKALAAKDDEPALDKNGCPLPPKTAKGKVALPPKTRMTAREKANDTRCKALAAKDKDEAADQGRAGAHLGAGRGRRQRGRSAQGLGRVKAKAPDLFRGRRAGRRRCAPPTAC